MNAQEYLVHHGIAGHLGRFRATDGASHGRGAAVVVRSLRGLELGEVLCPSYTDRFALSDPFVGDIVRVVTSADLTAAEHNREFGQRLFDEASRLAETLTLPLAVVDVEVLHDGRQVLLHALRLGPCDEGPLLAALGERHGRIVRLHDLATEEVAEVEEEEAKGGCESCGSGGGGCETCSNDGGGCNSCSAGAGQELANYFAELRTQMEQRQRVSLL